MPYSYGVQPLPTYLDHHHRPSQVTVQYPAIQAQIPTSISATNPYDFVPGFIANILKPVPQVHPPRTVPVYPPIVQPTVSNLAHFNNGLVHTTFPTNPVVEHVFQISNKASNTLNNFANKMGKLVNGLVSNAVNNNGKNGYAGNNRYSNQHPNQNQRPNKQQPIPQPPEVKIKIEWSMYNWVHHYGLAIAHNSSHNTLIMKHKNEFPNVAIEIEWNQ